MAGHFRGITPEWMARVATQPSAAEYQVVRKTGDLLIGPDQAADVRPHFDPTPERVLSDKAGEAVIPQDLREGGLDG